MLWSQIVMWFKWRYFGLK